MNAGTLLASLIAGATFAGAVLYNQHAPASSLSSSQRISQLEREIEVLKAENFTLKSINATTGEVTLPLEFYTFVEKNIGLEFFPHLKAIKVDQDKLVEAAEYRWVKQFGQANIDNRHYVFGLLGIIPLESVNYTKQLAEVETSADLGNIGVYDVVAKELLLHPHFNIDDKTQQVELIRLLSIALLEQHYPAAEDLTDDAFFTRDAIIKGRAEMVANRFQNINLEEEEPTKLTLKHQAKTSQLIQTIRHFSRVDGRSYIENILEKKRDVFPELYQYIPQQSSFIYLNVPFIKKERKKRKLLPNKPKERILIDSEFGQVILRTLIRKLSDQHPELDKELAYDTVHFTQDLNHPDYPNLTWKITWTGNEPAKTFTDLFNTSSKYSVATQRGNLVTITLK